MIFDTLPEKICHQKMMEMSNKKWFPGRLNYWSKIALELENRADRSNLAGNMLWP